MHTERFAVPTLPMRRALSAAFVAAALLTAVATGPSVAHPSAGDESIAFIRFIDDEAHLMVVRPDGSAEREIWLPNQGFLPSWSPDGRRLVVTNFADDTLRPMLVDPSNGATTSVHVPEAPTDLALLCRAWTPDGRRLLCQGDTSATHPESNGIYTIRTDGSHLTRLTTDAFPPVFGDEGTCGGGDQPGSVSPDGASFVFTRTRCGSLPAPDADQTAALFVERMNGTGLRQITPYGLPWSHEEGLARWSPDGRRILFATADGQLMTTRPDGGGRRTVPFGRKGDDPFAIAPDWSPDGSQIVFNLFLATGPSGLHVVDSDGRHLELLVAIGDSFVNNPDWGGRPG